MSFLKKFFFQIIFRFLMSYKDGAFLSAQLEKPSGWFGRMYIARMLDMGNAALYDFCLEHMQVQTADRVLEIGFGGGRQLAQLVELASAGYVAGVDFSPEMVEVARANNKAALQTGRLEIEEGSLVALAYEDASFQKILTVNTLYFWPDPLANAREVLRVLAPGGTLYIGFRTREIMERIPNLGDNFRLYSFEEVTELFQKAGAKDVRFEERQEAVGFPSTCAIVTR